MPQSEFGGASRIRHCRRNSFVMTIHFIGAGPGASDLITVHAVAISSLAARSASTPVRWFRANCWRTVPRMRV